MNRRLGYCIQDDFAVEYDKYVPDESGIYKVDKQEEFYHERKSLQLRLRRR